MRKGRLNPIQARELEQLYYDYYLQDGSNREESQEFARKTVETHFETVHPPKEIINEYNLSTNELGQITLDDSTELYQVVNSWFFSLMILDEMSMEDAVKRILWSVESTGTVFYKGIWYGLKSCINYYLNEKS